MKRILSMLLTTAVLATSCSKKTTENVKPKSPLEKAIPAEYISTGASDNSLDVAFSTYKPNADCDKAVFDAAIETVQGSSGVNKVTVRGTNVTMTFDRGSNVQPALISLTSGSSLDKEVRKDWSWKGYLTIKKQNTFLTKDQFLSAVNVKVSAVNTGDEAQVLSKSVAGDIMLIEYKLTKSNPAYSQAVAYEVQSSTPVTFMSQLAVECIIPDFISQQTTAVIDISSSLPAVEQKEVGSGITSYKQQVYQSWMTKSLSEYIALRFFAEKLYPTLK